MKNIRNGYLNSILEYLNLGESYEIFKKISNKNLYSKVYPLLKKQEEPKFFTEEHQSLFPFCLIGTIQTLLEGCITTIAYAFFIKPDLIISSLSKKDIEKVNELEFFHRNKSYKILKVAYKEIEKIVLMKIEGNIVNVDYCNIEEDFLGKNKYKLLEKIDYLDLDVYMLNIQKGTSSTNYFQKIETCVKNNLNERIHEFDFCFRENYLSGSPIFLKCHDRLFLYGIYVNPKPYEKSYCFRFFDCYYADLIKKNQIKDSLLIYFDYFSKDSIEVKQISNSKEISYLLSNYSFSNIENIKFQNIILKKLPEIVFPVKTNFNLKNIVLTDSMLDFNFFKELFNFLKGNSVNMDHITISGNCIKANLDSLVNDFLINLSTNSTNYFKFSNNDIEYQDFQLISPFLSKLTNIEYLDLSRNNIDDKSIQIMSLSLKNLTHLKTLILAYNNIDDTGSEVLSKNIEVHLLDLSNNCISLSGEKKVISNIPKFTKVIFSGKSMYGLREGKIIDISKSNKDKDKQCCYIY